MVGILNKEPLDLRVTEEEAREIAYHYIRLHLKDKLRPKQTVEVTRNGYGESVWMLELVDRENGQSKGQLTVGVETGSTHKWDPSN